LIRTLEEALALTEDLHDGTTGFVVILHWQQFLSLFGFGQEPAEFAVRLKDPPLPWLYVTIIFSLVMLLRSCRTSELIRGLRRRMRIPLQD
jgi:hypothetical protein